MRFRFCPDCGKKLSARDLGDDKDVPWCDGCSKPWFDIFPTCVIALVHDGAGRVLLLRQGYISRLYANLVSGYMKPGESAEEAAAREIAEETGLEVRSLEFAGSYWFERKGLLMIGFFAEVAPGEPRISVEVDSAEWVAAREAPAMVHPAGSVSNALCTAFAAKLNH